MAPAVRHNLAKTTMAAMLEEEPVGGEHPFFAPDWCPGPRASEAVRKWISSSCLFYVQSLRSRWCWQRNDGMSHKCPKSFPE